MKNHLFSLLFLALAAVPRAYTQETFHWECFTDDLGGLITAGDPDVVTLNPMTATTEVQTLEGCLTPSNADYNDLFRLFVPEGYEVTAIQFGYLGEEFLDDTELNFSLWYGTDCQPLGSPAVYSGGYNNNPDYNNWLGNMIAGVAPLPGNAWYSMRIDMDGWPSSGLYYLHFTFSCADGEAPAFTTAPGAMDAELNCLNWVGLTAALAAEPEGEDNAGNVELQLLSDVTTPDPGCPNAYTRVRTWTLTDACGNEAAQTYTQTITVYDNTPPTFVTNAGALDAALECDDAAGLNAALAMSPVAADACGSASLVLLSDTTTPDDDCPNAYLRIRAWRATDGCGNLSLAVFYQTIQVYDDTPPVAVALNPVIAIADEDGYVLAPADVLNVGATYDDCGAIEVISIQPSVLGCELLGQIVPVTITVADACGNTTQAVAMVTVTEDTSIKAPWDHTDIGAAANGSASHSPCEGTYTLTASGFPMPAADVNHFVYADLCGDGELVARVLSVNPSSGWAGVMVRENLTPGARKAVLKTGLNNTLRREVRTAANMNAQLQQSPALPGPIWMRITRSGNTFNLYTSPDGKAWQFQGAAALNVGNCVQLGLFVESTNNNTAVTAVFEGVSATGGIVPLAAGPASPEAESTQPYGLLEQEAVSVFPNPGDGNYQIDLSPYDGQRLTLRVTDALGRLVKISTVLAGPEPEPLALPELPAGLYLLQIQPEGGAPAQVVKLVKQ